MEDYVLSYMKQHRSDTKTKVYLYGEKKIEENREKYFIYCTAVAKQQTEEERYFLRKNYFPSYEYIGWGWLANEIPDGFHICDEGKEEYIEGYYSFYDENESMLSYMVEERELGKITNRSAFPNESPLPQQSQAEKEVEKEDSPGTTIQDIKDLKTKSSKLKLAVITAFLIMCLVSFRDNIFKEVSGDGTSTLVTENELANAVLEEQNQVSCNDLEGEREPVSFDPLPIETAGLEQQEQQVQQVQQVAVDKTETEQTNYYIVQEGDTLSTISLNHYGNRTYVKSICQLNGITEPDKITVGQRILLP